MGEFKLRSEFLLGVISPETNIDQRPEAGHVRRHSWVLLEQADRSNG